MLPQKGVDYSFSEVPTHLSTELDGDVPFLDYFGGVTLFNVQDFKIINGYSNEYWGWGFEDDDLLYRCIGKGLSLETKKIGLPEKEFLINYFKFNGSSSYIRIPYKNMSSVFSGDFTISMNVIKQGFKSEYREDAIVYESVAPTVEAEFNRHIRDATGHYLSLLHLKSMLNPFLGMSSFVFWSHRVFRWTVPFLLIILFILNTQILNIYLYEILFYLQISFYSLVVFALLFIKMVKLPFFIFITFYFCNLNTALFIGFIKALYTKQNGMWESTKR
jgi:hypothetical protein